MYLRVQEITWKNCPGSLRGQYHNTKEGKLATIAVEAYKDRDLYVSHWFACRCGTNNDKTLLEESPVFNSILNGMYDIKLLTDYRLHRRAPITRVGYFFVNGICPRWTICARLVHSLANRKEKQYKKIQEALRKNIESAFGVIQARFEVMRKESFIWYKKNVAKVSKVCVIIHYMLVPMNQERLFAEDLQTEAQGANIITELYEEEATGLNERREERTQQEEEAEATVMVDDRFDMEALLIKESILMSSLGFNALCKELVKCVEENGRR